MKTIKVDLNELKHLMEIGYIQIGKYKLELIIDKS